MKQYSAAHIVSGLKLTCELKRVVFITKVRSQRRLAKQKNCCTEA